MPIEKLIKGFESFRESNYSQTPDRYVSLGEKGQSPDTMVIACSDSRVSPTAIFSAQPNEIFTVRNVANLVPKYQPDQNYDGTSAAIEYAVQVLSVDHIIVLGHSNCGGIDNLCKMSAKSTRWEFIDQWVSIVSDARKSQMSGDMLNKIVEQGAITISLQNLLTFPWVEKAVESGSLELHGWWFDIKTGTLKSRSKKSDWVTLR
ncbi:MAG: carbonic anhydrase [Pseudomonadota bacterium]|nr:carbonic anhydrase [Pseudomonadota bacterium]